MVNRKQETQKSKESNKRALDKIGMKFDLIERYLHYVTELNAFLELEEEGFLRFNTNNEKLLFEEKNLKAAIECNNNAMAEHLERGRAFNFEIAPSEEERQAALIHLQQDDALDHETELLRVRISEFRSACQDHQIVGLAHDDKNDAFKEEGHIIGENLIGLFREIFRDTQNPIYVWVTISVCREPYMELSIPEWCIAYLANCAEKIRVLIGGHETPDAPEITALFGFSKPGWNAFATCKTDIDHYKMSAIVNTAVEFGLSKNETIEQFSEISGLQPRSIQRILARAKTWTLNSELDDLTSQSVRS